ncbi:transposase [Candidatus Mesenet endosymbiont of Agriotes lineatus]|uniref:transposase n=1 Tax=Candidatus Mesenet endosymbiont of Agriotes lineatus TaxID=3077948 RepID=UPI003977BCAD
MILAVVAAEISCIPFLSGSVDIVSGNITPDHVHMLISMPPTIQQYIKGNVSYSKSLNN